MYHVFQATRRKILDSDRGSFTDLKTGNKMLIGDAVDQRLVEIEFDMNASGKVMVLYHISNLHEQWGVLWNRACKELLLPTMHYFGIPRHAQPMIAYKIFTERFLEFR